MLATIRHRSSPKLPILLLVFLLCVQSLGFASHGLMTKVPVQTEVAEQSMPPCHDMPDMQMGSTSEQDHAKPLMPCCEDGQCADAHCMMPAGTYFMASTQDFFISFSAVLLQSNSYSIDSIKASPPIRPPIA